MGWVCYTALGLAFMPIDILKGQKHIDRLQATIEERESLLGNRYSQIRDKAWRQGVGALSRRERRDAEVSERSRCAIRYSVCVESFANRGLDFAWICMTSQSRHSDMCAQSSFETAWVSFALAQIAAGPRSPGAATLPNRAERVPEQMSHHAVLFGRASSLAHVSCAGSSRDNCTRRFDPQHWTAAWICDDRGVPQAVQHLEHDTEPELRGRDWDVCRHLRHRCALCGASHSHLVYRLLVRAVTCRTSPSPATLTLGTDTFVALRVRRRRGVPRFLCDASTIYGIFTIGLLRSCKIKPHRTLPQSLLVAVFVVVFTLYGVVLTLPAMAPQFFDYGCQKQPGLVEGDPPRECTRGAASPYCINTQFSLVSAWMRLSLPPLGVAVFAASWVRGTPSASTSLLLASTVPLNMFSSLGSALVNSPVISPAVHSNSLTPGALLVCRSLLACWWLG